MKLLNPSVLKYAYVCSDHFTDEDYVRNHTLQSGLLQSTVNKVLKRDAFLEGLGTCELGVHNLSHFFKKKKQSTIDTPFIMLHATPIASSLTFFKDIISGNQFS